MIDDGIEVERTRWPRSLNSEELLWNLGKFEIAEFLNDKSGKKIGVWDATNNHSVYLMHTDTELTYMDYDDIWQIKNDYIKKKVQKIISCK